MMMTAAVSEQSAARIVDVPQGEKPTPGTDVMMVSEIEPTSPEPLDPARALKRAIDLETEAAALPEGSAKAALLEQAQSLRELAGQADLTPP